MVTPAEELMGKPNQGCCCWMRALSWLRYNSNHLSLLSVRNQVCVAKVTSAKLPAMTKQWEPFCFIDCSSYGPVRVLRQRSQLGHRFISDTLERNL